MYINTNKVRPSQYSSDENTKQLGVWYFHYRKGYNNNIGVMKNQEIREEWEKFIKEYGIYFN